MINKYYLSIFDKDISIVTREWQLECDIIKFSLRTFALRLGFAIEKISREKNLLMQSIFKKLAAGEDTKVLNEEI